MFKDIDKLISEILSLHVTYENLTDEAKDIVAEHLLNKHKILEKMLKESDKNLTKNKK